MKIIPIILTIIFTAFGQIFIKKGVNQLPGSNFTDIFSIVKYSLNAITNFWVFSGFFSALIAAFSWLIVLKNFELSSVYLYQSLNFVLVPLLAIYFFSESFDLNKTIGTIIIVIGLIVFSKTI